jgi:hypothetical protein
VDGILKKVSATSHVMPIVAVAHLLDESQQNESLSNLVVVLDGVKDHEHLATVVRTAAVFGAPVQGCLRDGGRFRLAEQGLQTSRHQPAHAAGAIPGAPGRQAGGAGGG